MIIDELIALLGYKVDNPAALAQYNKSLDALEKKAYAVGQAIGKTAVIAGTLAAAGFAMLGKSVLSTSAEFEGYQATLETIEGSTEKAKASLDWITQFAKTTPYAVDEVTRAFVKLKAYGMDPADGTLQFLGDTASGMGKSLNMAVEALADATTNQFERLKEFGITTKQEGEAVTFSWQENGKSMTKQVKKNGKEITKALKEIWGTKFAGAMVRQSKTWNGMMSNLGDTWTQFLRRIGDAGAFARAKEALGGLMDTINAAFDDGTVDKLASAFSGAFEAVINGIAAFATRIAFYIQTIGKNFETLKPYLTGLGIALGILMAAAFPVTTALLGVALAIDDIISYMTGGESVIGSFIGWIGQLASAFANSEIGGPFVKALQDMAKYLNDAFVFLGGFISALTGLDGGSASAGLTVIWEVVKGIAGVFGDLLGLLGRLIEWAIPDDAFGTNAMETGKRAAQGLINILNTLLGLPAQITAAFAAMVISIPTPAMPAFPGIAPGISSGGATGPSMNPGVTAGENIGRMAGPQNGAKINAPTTNNTQSNVNVGGVNVHVQSPASAPAAVGKAVGAAVGNAAVPEASRVQSGSAM